MSDKNVTNIYDDGNIPDADLKNSEKSQSKNSAKEVEPLPESTRPRKDGPGGE